MQRQEIQLGPLPLKIVLREFRFFYLEITNKGNNRKELCIMDSPRLANEAN